MNKETDRSLWQSTQKFLYPYIDIANIILYLLYFFPMD